MVAKVWIGSSRDFVSGRIMRPIELHRRLTQLRERHKRRVDLLASLPAEITKIEADIKASEEELAQYNLREIPS